MPNQYNDLPFNSFVIESAIKISLLYYLQMDSVSGVISVEDTMSDSYDDELPPAPTRRSDIPASRRRTTLDRQVIKNSLCNYFSLYVGASVLKQFHP